MCVPIICAHLIKAYIILNYIYSQIQNIMLIKVQWYLENNFYNSKSLCFLHDSTYFYFLKILFIYSWETERETGRDTGRGRSRLPAGSPMQDSIPGSQDHNLSWRQTLNTIHYRIITQYGAQIASHLTFKLVLVSFVMASSILRHFLTFSHEMF